MFQYLFIWEYIFYRMNPSDIQEATCTDLPQQWGKTGKSMHYLFEPIPISQFCHVRKRKRERIWNGDSVTEDMLSVVKRIMFEGEK